MPAQVRLVPIVASAVAVAFAAFGVLPAGAQEAPVEVATPAASIDKVGWWNVSRGPQPGEPDTPVRPALAPVPAPPTNVPADSVGVGAAVGDATKVAAVGILLEGAAGGTVDALTLTLKESTAPGANLATDAAAIVACPITGFWGETRNGNWIDRPTADCTLAEAAGTRSGDGTWTFDLAPVASAAGWLDPTSSVGQNGVLLVEKVEAPAGFDASFPDPAAGGMTLAFSATGGGAVTDPFAAGGDTLTTGDSFTLGDAPGATFGSGDLGRTDPFTLSPAPVPGGAPAAAPAGGTRGTANGRRPSPSAATAPATRAGDLVGNLSPATYLLIPVALLAGLALSLYLGAARPAPATATAAGGVSRALARRERAESRTPQPHPTPRSAS